MLRKESGALGDIAEQVKEIVDRRELPSLTLQAIADLLYMEVDHYDWVGFYLTDDSGKALALGPYCGDATEHTLIAFGDGICGQAAEREETFVVQDVSKETNYLSCSPAVKSEIVVPIMREGKVLGEVDIDSHALAPFTDEDRKLLEEVAGLVAGVV